MKVLPCKVLFGGSFDPVHEGHLKTAEALLSLPGSKDIYLLPSACSPLKTAGTPDHHRLGMLRIAAADYPGLLVDDRELHRPPPSFTVDTLRELRAEYGQEISLVWVIGADTLNNLSRWKEWKKLTELAHLLVVDRPDAEWPSEGTVADWLAGLPSAGSMDQLQWSASGKLARLALPPQPFSSTVIRARLRERDASSTKPDGLPECVWHYILRHHLYLPGTLPDTGHEAL